MGSQPVTQAQWRAVLGTNPSRLRDDSHPVEQVSWHDCQEFCEGLGRRTGQRVRLPTEAQWEYACRAGTATPFHFGETLSTDQANYNGWYTYRQGRKGVYRQQTTPVGNFPPNAWGLFDLHGGVWEWCLDCYGKYPEGEVSDPRTEHVGTARVLRGGSWYNIPWSCRSACRDWGEPGVRDRDIGCRVLLSLD
jgi:formylglycine-generating enzyme required for sulfatase activity